MVYARTVAGPELGSWTTVVHNYFREVWKLDNIKLTKTSEFRGQFYRKKLTVVTPPPRPNYHQTIDPPLRTFPSV